MKVLTYKGENLHPASKAAELLREKKFDQLDEHMRQVNEVYYRLRGEKPPKKQKSVAEGQIRFAEALLDPPAPNEALQAASALYDRLVDPAK